MRLRSRVTLDLDTLGLVVMSIGKNYVTPRDLSRRLAVSTKTAGRILKRLEKLGYVERYSTRAYRVVKIYGDNINSGWL